MEALVNQHTRDPQANRPDEDRRSQDAPKKREDALGRSASPAGAGGGNPGDLDLEQRQAMELRELRRRLARSRENERLRLAQDLHDGPLQDLYAVHYRLQALQRTFNKNPDEPFVQTAGQLELVRANLKQVNNALRAICNNLRPPALGPFGLEAAIRSHAERFQQMYPHLTVTLDLMPDGQTLPAYVRLTLFRIYQEMVSNVARHAAAQNVLVRFTFDADELLLEIQDDGRGFDVPERWIELARQGHLGLVGASERAEEINGRLTILSAPTQGAIVRVQAPRVATDELDDEGNNA